MVCERLTDEQRTSIEQLYPYAMKCAMIWADRCGRLADCDDFKSAATDALIRSVQRYRPELGELRGYFLSTLRGDMGELHRRLFGGGLVGSSRNGCGKMRQGVPMAGRSVYDIAEPVSVGDDFEMIEIEDALASLHETHKSYLNSVIAGVKGKQLAAKNGRTASNERMKIRQARAAFAQLMGVA